MKTWRQKIILKAFLDGLYGATQDGAVYSNRGKTRRFLKPSLNHKNYYGVCFSIKNRLIHAKVHQVVYLFFKGEYPETYQINHKDGNKLNNHLSNLEAGSASCNVKHAYRLGLICRKGENHPRSKLSEDDVKEIEWLSKNGFSSRDISSFFSCSASNVRKILCGSVWSHIK